MNAKTFEMVKFREHDRGSELPRMEVVVSWADHVRDSREISAKKSVRNLTAEAAEKFSADSESDEKQAVSADAATVCGESEELRKGLLGNGCVGLSPIPAKPELRESAFPSRNSGTRVKMFRWPGENSQLERKPLHCNDLRKIGPPKKERFDGPAWKRGLCGRREPALRISMYKRKVVVSPEVVCRKGLARKLDAEKGGVSMYLDVHKAD